eukprot:scaffold1485_cov171-Amphora_coffeaeformis.AAC.10
MDTILKAITSLPSVTHLKFVNVGGSRGKDRVYLEEFTSFFETTGPRLESVVFDGGSLVVEKGFPVCEGPMGMEECTRFDFINDFTIQYIGNPALGFFDSPVEMSLDGILSTIQKLPKLMQEEKDKIKVTDKDAEVARRKNQNRAAEDSALDGFGRLNYDEDSDLDSDEDSDDDSDGNDRHQEEVEEEVAVE